MCKYTGTRATRLLYGPKANYLLNSEYHLKKTKESFNSGFYSPTGVFGNWRVILAFQVQG